MSKLAILILAAGKSSRMGIPKQLLEWNGTTLLQHAINTVKKVEKDAIVVVLGAHFEKIKNHVNSDEATVLFNENWQKGLGNSLAFGINYIKETMPHTKGVLILLTDQPLVDSSHINKLIDTYMLWPNKIVCTSYQNNQCGVPAIFSKMYFEELAQLHSDTGAKEILKKHDKEVVSIKNANVTEDMDTLKDYQNLYDKFH